MADDGMEIGKRHLRLVEDPLNDRGKEAIEKLAEKTRKELIQHVFDVFKVHILAERDPELKKSLEQEHKARLSRHPTSVTAGTPFEIYLVAIDSQVAPDENDIQPGCFVINLKSDDELDLDDNGDDDEITVYMPPNPPDFDIEADDIDILKLPDVVYFKIEDLNGGITRCSVDKDIFFEYTKAGDQSGAGQEIEDDSYNLARLKKAKTEARKLNRLFEEIINMKVAPQIKPAS